MSDLTIERPESGYAVWKNRDGDIVCDWNDDANINFPEDLTSHRDIGDLVSVVYKKGFSDGNMQPKQQLEDYKQENQLLIETNCELLNGELVKRLQQQLEVENKNNYEISAEMEHLRNQLKEAVEVIEFYGDKKNWDTRDKLFDYFTLAKIIDEDDLDDRDNYFVKVYGGKRARQFLAKYRGV